MNKQIEYLSGFMLPERFGRLCGVLGDRTRWMTVLMENTFHAQNASALVRHCDAFGVQDIHTVETLCKFTPNVDIVLGTDRWVTFHRHKTTAGALGALRANGYRIVATTPHRGDCRPEDFDVAAGTFVLVFGTEHAGISDEVMAAADEFIRIPMCGFVESLNVSASAAIMLYILSEKLRGSGVEWRLPEREREEELLLWMRRSVKDADKILQRL
jgi:tRNA (guanosine-2'-O-)-methyltransferase